MNLPWWVKKLFFFVKSTRLQTGCYSLVEISQIVTKKLQTYFHNIFKLISKGGKRLIWKQEKLRKNRQLQWKPWPRFLLREVCQIKSCFRGKTFRYDLREKVQYMMGSYLLRIWISSTFMFYSYSVWVCWITKYR